ncbi:MAG: diacylglycerol kinase family protein [Patescibacteria group bacterium]|jgi:diacylglycerol kinase family enzyme|nr:diacylglycerol kinase family protein [bacterium]HQC49913.1 diacylglycerol kinase family protein [bacterium]
MHVYIYDDYLNRGRYNKTVNRMEIRLTDLGLNGKIIRLSGIKNIRGTIQNEIKLGAKTIVAVGNNQTVNKIIGAIIEADIYGDFQKNTLLGIVPIGPDNSIASSFGIKNEEQACNILLARRIKKIDLGLIGSYYFLNEARIESLGTKINFADYSIEAQERGEIRIINLLSDRSNTIKSNPHDGLLDILIKTKKGGETLLRAKNFSLINERYNLLLDGVVEVKTPNEVKVVSNRINVIVGKDRSFD